MPVARQVISQTNSLRDRDNKLTVNQPIFPDSKHVGDAAEPNFVGRATSLQCGAVLRISVHVDQSQRITDAKFKAAGCSTLVASTSSLLDQVIGKTNAEAATLAQRVEEMENLEEPTSGRVDCLVMAHEALLAAIHAYSNSVRDEWEGDEALICTCFCVSERTIEQEVQRNNLRTVADVTRACNAGGGCRSCYPLIEEILEEVNGKW
jgi:NifU-like protein